MVNEEIIRIMTALQEVPGISGHEGKVGQRMEELLEGCFDEHFIDTLGNYFFVKRGKPGGKQVLVCAHMDEIGFLVSDIWEDGYVSVLPVGMHNIELLRNQAMTIYTASGEVKGVIGAPPVHCEEGQTKLSYHDLLLDVGTNTREETEKLGIQPGDMITHEREYRVLNGRIFSGLAVDNRSGCAAMIAALRLLKDENTEATVYCCGTVMEEMGVKGAAPAALLVKPEMAVCLDVCFGAVHNTIDENNRRNHLGKGPVIMLYDWNDKSCLGNIVPEHMKGALIQAAGKADIPYQLGVTMNCGTDAALVSLSGTGVLTGGIGIPNRYMHTAVGTVSIDDVRQAGELLASFIKYGTENNTH